MRPAPVASRRRAWRSSRRRTKTSGGRGSNETRWELMAPAGSGRRALHGVPFGLPGVQPPLQGHGVLASGRDQQLRPTGARMFAWSGAVEDGAQPRREATRRPLRGALDLLQGQQDGPFGPAALVGLRRCARPPGRPCRPAPRRGRRRRRRRGTSSAGSAAPPLWPDSPGWRSVTPEAGRRQEERRRQGSRDHAVA